MKLNRALALSLALLSFADRPASADVIAMTFTGGSTAVSQFTRGWSFSTADAITLTSLGWWDFGGDGLNSSHQVGIWTAGGDLLNSATVAAGTTDPLSNGFRFNSSLTGTTTLGPGTYVIGGKSEANDLVAFAVPLGNLALAPGIAYIENRTNVGASFAFPGAPQADLNAGVFGPTFTFTATAIPEPSSMAFGLVGLLIGGYRLARRR